MGGGGSAPKPPKFVPLDIGELAATMTQKDQEAWAKSHADRNLRQPLIEPGIRKSTDQAFNNLGAADPGLVDILRSSGSSMKPEASAQGQARQQGKTIQDIEKRHRSYFSDLMSANPQEPSGPNKDDILQLYATNANSQNQFNQANFSSRINSYNSSIMQGAQNNMALAQGLGGIAGIFSKFAPTGQPQTGSLDPSYYNTGPVNNGSFWQGWQQNAGSGYGLGGYGG